MKKTTRIHPETVVIAEKVNVRPSSSKHSSSSVFESEGASECSAPSSHRSSATNDSDLNMITGAMTPVGPITGLFGKRRRKGFPISIITAIVSVLIMTIVCVVLVCISVVTTKNVSATLVNSQMETVGASIAAGFADLRQKTYDRLFSFVNMTNAMPMVLENPANGTLDFSKWPFPAVMMRQMYDDPMFDTYIHAISPNIDNTYTFYFENVTFGVPLFLLQTYQMVKNASIWFPTPTSMIDFDAPDFRATMRSPREAPVWAYLQMLAAVPVAYGVITPSPTMYNGKLWTAAGAAHQSFTADGDPIIRMMQFKFASFSELVTRYKVTQNSVVLITDDRIDALALSTGMDDLFIYGPPLKVAGEEWAGGIGRGFSGMFPSPYFEPEEHSLSTRTVDYQVRYKNLTELGSKLYTQVGHMVHGWGGFVPDDHCQEGVSSETLDQTVTKKECQRIFAGKAYFVDVITWKENMFSSTYYALSLVPIKDITRESDRQIMRLAIISVAAIVCGAIVVFAAVAAITRPLRKFARVLEKTALLAYDPSRDKLNIPLLLKSAEADMLRICAIAVIRCISSLKVYASPGVVKRIISNKLKPRPLLSMDDDEDEARPTDITVAFIDVVNFTTYTDIYGVRAMAKALAKFCELVVEMVAEYGGDATIVDKFIGDCAMIMAGGLDRTRDHSRKTVELVMRIVQRINEEDAILIVLPEKLTSSGTCEKTTIPMRVKAGVASGPAYVGNIGCATRMNFTALGGTVNTAARLESTAGKFRYQIGVSKEVYNRTSENFVYRKVVTTDVKGLDALEIYEPYCLVDSPHTTDLKTMCEEWDATLRILETPSRSMEERTQLVDRYMERHPEDRIARAVREHITEVFH